VGKKIKWGPRIRQTPRFKFIARKRERRGKSIGGKRRHKEGGGFFFFPIRETVVEKTEKATVVGLTAKKKTEVKLIVMSKRAGKKKGPPKTGKGGKLGGGINENRVSLSLTRNSNGSPRSRLEGEKSRKGGDDKKQKKAKGRQ